METSIFRFLIRRPAVLCALGAGIPAVLHAGSKSNPTSKFYVADVDGDAQIDTGEKVDDLTRQSVYNAEGTVVETKPNASNAMVFSNGTGVFFDQDTRMEVKKFEQEPFVPNRTDMNVEPSISQTQNYVPRGTVGLCTSQLVAGSSMTYQTPLGSVNIQGGKLVVSSQNNQSVISVLDGQSTVNVGDVDNGGQVLKSGQQAVITPGTNGGPSSVTIQNIPQNQQSTLNQKVTMACNARKTVYFETAAAKPQDTIVPTNAPASVTNAAGNNASSSSNNNDTSSGSTQTITAFDGNDGTVSSKPTTTTTSSPPVSIVAVPVAPSTTPVQYTTSPANITTTPGTP